MLPMVSLQMFKYSRNTLPEVISELFITNAVANPGGPGACPPPPRNA